MVIVTGNMGTIDRGLRAFVVAPIAISVGFILGASTIAGVGFLVVAGIMLTTAATGFCPTYTVVGISTRPRLHRVRPKQRDSAMPRYPQRSTSRRRGTNERRASSRGRAIRR